MRNNVSFSASTYTRTTSGSVSIMEHGDKALRKRVIHVRLADGDVYIKEFNLARCSKC